MKVKSRTGPENFITCMRKQLASHYGDKPVAMGGVFLIAKGKANLHIMVRISGVNCTVTKCTVCLQYSYLCKMYCCLSTSLSQIFQTSH